MGALSHGRNRDHMSYESERHRVIIAEAIEALTTVPEHLRAGLRRYIEHGVEPGGFLCAAIENDFVGAVSRWHGFHSGVQEVVSFLHNFMPPPAWGSKERRLAWQAATKALEGTT